MARDRGNINQVTLRQPMCTLRVFLKWAASIDAVDPELYDKVMVPQISREERKRDAMLDVKEARELLGHLTKYHFASSDHVTIALLWETGIRTGAAHSIDLEVVHLREVYINLVRRPDQETTLKNGKTGERPIAITPELAELLGATKLLARHCRAGGAKRVLSGGSARSSADTGTGR